LNIIYLSIYLRFKLKFVKGQLASDEIDLDNFSAPSSPIKLYLKIRKEKISKAK
jgi:hypothetical protein